MCFVLFSVVITCFSSHLSGLRGRQSVTRDSNSIFRSQSVASSGGQRSAVTLNRRTDRRRISTSRNSQTSASRFQNGIATSNRLSSSRTRAMTSRRRQDARTTRFRDGNSLTGNELNSFPNSVQRNTNSIETNISIQRRPSNTETGGRTTRNRNRGRPNTRQTGNGQSRINRIRAQRRNLSARRGSSAARRNRVRTSNPGRGVPVNSRGGTVGGRGGQSNQQIVNNLANTRGRFGDIARSIILEETLLKQLNAVYPECTIDDVSSSFVF